MKSLKIFFGPEISDKKDEILLLIQRSVDTQVVDSIVQNTLVIEESHIVDWNYIVTHCVDENARFVFLNEFIENGFERDMYISSGISFNKNSHEPVVDHPIVKYNNYSLRLTPVLFLDRDGILNEDTGYVYEFKDSIIFQDIIETIKLANSLNIPVVIVTNQAGVARGMYTLKDVELFHKKLLSFYKERGAVIDHVEVCPFHKDKGEARWRYDSLLRKPNPGMLLKGLAKVNGSACNSLMVGDKESDRINLKGVRSLLLSGNYKMKPSTDVCFSREELCEKTSKYLNNLLDLS